MSLVIENCKVIVPSGGDLTIRSGSIFVHDGIIEQIGTHRDVPADASRLNASGCVVTPGLVNTHHHMFQNLTRTMGQDKELFGWLGSLWGRWRAHDVDWQYAATRLACAELLLSGCTTTVDHHYLPLLGSRDPLVAQAEAAGQLGIRLIQAIGSMDVSDEAGGLAPTALCEGADAYLARAEDAIRGRHDPSVGARLQVALAPCHPLAVSERYARSTVELARLLGVRIHTHLAEGRDEEAATLAMTGMRPLELLEHWGLTGPDVWLAHCVHLNERDIRNLATSETAVATCPSSNLRLGSGIARVRDMLDSGVTVGLGVDGSASNDSGNALHEARQLLLASRANGIARGVTACEALDIATAGGASVLGRADIGQVLPGQRADLAIFGLDSLASVGTDADPVAGLLLSPPASARHVVVDGEVVVRDGALTSCDLSDVRDQAKTVIKRRAGDI